VRALRGEFSIHGTPGRGTMIEVTLPVPSDDASPATATTDVARSSVTSA